MTKAEIKEDIINKFMADHPKSANTDEIAAFVLTLLQYGWALYLDHDRESSDVYRTQSSKIIGVGASGVICQLGNMMYTTYKWPKSSDDLKMNSSASGYETILPNEITIKRPARKGCSFGTALEAINNDDDGDCELDL